MATVQKILADIVSRIDPVTKKGQKIQDNSSPLTVSGATNATPIVITTSAVHSLRTGDEVNIQGVGGNTAANNTVANPRWVATVVTTTTFSLDGSAGNGIYASGGTVVPALVGSVDGDKFFRDRHLSIYNDSRIVLFRAMKEAWDSDRVAEAISGAVVESQIQFTRVSNRYEYTLPAGYLRFESLLGFSTTSKRIEEVVLLPHSYRSEVMSDLGEFTQSNDIRFVFEIATKLIHYGLFLGGHSGTGTVAITLGQAGVTGTNTKFLAEAAASAKITINSEEKTVAIIYSDTSLDITATWAQSVSGVAAYFENYKLTYIGLTALTISDVLGGTVSETINTDFQAQLIAIAEQVAAGLGAADLRALANSLIGGINGNVPVS